MPFCEWTLRVAGPHEMHMYLQSDGTPPFAEIDPLGAWFRSDLCGSRSNSSTAAAEQQVVAELILCGKLRQLSVRLLRLPQPRPTHLLPQDAAGAVAVFTRENTYCTVDLAGKLCAASAMQPKPQERKVRQAKHPAGSSPSKSGLQSTAWHLRATNFTPLS